MVSRDSLELFVPKQVSATVTHVADDPASGFRMESERGDGGTHSLASRVGRGSLPDPQVGQGDCLSHSVARLEVTLSSGRQMLLDDLGSQGGRELSAGPATHAVRNDHHASIVIENEGVLVLRSPESGIGNACCLPPKCQKFPTRSVEKRLTKSPSLEGLGVEARGGGHRYAKLGTLSLPFPLTKGDPRASKGGTADI